MSSNPSTPNRTQGMPCFPCFQVLQKVSHCKTDSQHPVSPFTLHVPDGQTPRRFSEQHRLSKLALKINHLAVPPGQEFSYEDLDWLTEYYLQLNAGLTEPMISLHVRLHRAEDKVAALEMYIENNL